MLKVHLTMSFSRVKAKEQCSGSGCICEGAVGIASACWEAGKASTGAWDWGQVIT
jgi:hypothetical protein